MFASVKRVTDVAKPLVNQNVVPSASNLQKLELAKRLASRINMERNLGAEAQDVTQQAAAAIFSGTLQNAPAVSVSISFIFILFSQIYTWIMMIILIIHII